MATKTFEELKQLAIQIRDEKTNKQNTATRVGTAMLEHINKLEQDYYDKTTINNRTSEYNVSINHPTSGISSSNKYDLSSAIAQVPAELRTAGLTVSFLNESGDIEKWEFSGGSWAVSSFEQVGSAAIESQKDEVNAARDEALASISGKEQEAIQNFHSQRVTPEMLSESTKQLINASGGGTINNLADDEDLVSVNEGEGLSVLKFADRAYNPANFSGKGYKILRRNIVDGKNVLTQEMVNKENTIYEIKYDFDLNGQTVEIKRGCTVIFTYGGNCKYGTLWLHGRDISILGGKCEAKIKVGLTNDEITQVYSNWFNSNYNITIRDIELVNPIENAVSYMMALGDNYDMSIAQCAIELENIIGVNIINCGIYDHEVGIRYIQRGNLRQSVSRINILNNVIKHSYCCIYNKGTNEGIQDYGDTAISNNELYAVKNCINIESQDGVVISSNTMYGVVDDVTKTNNSAIRLAKVLNINILGNQIFGGQYGVLLEGKCNYTNISSNIFANIGKLLSKSSIENSDIIHVEDYTGTLNITGNTLAPQYTNHYIHLKNSKFADLVIVGNAFRANAEDLGKSVGYSELFSVYSKYSANYRY